jgi:hypothetical protein
MFEDFKEQVQTKHEKDIVNKALSASNRFTKQKSHKFESIDAVIDAVNFKYPEACFVQIVNLDKTDVDGYPETNTLKIHEVRITYNSTNTFNHQGRLVGTHLNNVSFTYRLVLVFVKAGEYKMIAQNVNGSGGFC